jgi:hypothetical protein
VRIISFDGFDFAANGYWVGFKDAAVRGQWSLQPTTLTRMSGAPVLAGNSTSARPIPVEIGYSGGATIETAFLALLGELDPTNGEPRALVAQLNDTTLVQCMATIMLPQGQTSDADVNVVEATFLTMSPAWRETSATTDLANVISSSGDSFTIVNSGYARAYPVYDIGWTAQRTTSTSAAGWKYRVTCTLTNNETRTESRNTRFIDLGDTTLLVPTKAMTTGNDVRVRYNGRELPRTLLNWNTKRTFIEVVVTIEALTTITLEIVYGNPNAGTPQTLSTLGGARTRPDLFSAIDGYAVNGTATSGGASTITNTSINYPVNRLAGGFIQITGGTGVNQRRRILSNTATSITVARAWSTAPAAGSTYVVWMSGLYVDGGTLTSATTTTLTDTAQNLMPSAFIGGTIFTSLGNRTITANTPNTFTFSPPLSGTPTGTYYIERPGFHSYAVDKSVKRGTNDVWMGLWYQDARYNKPAVIQTGADGIANAWQPYLMLRNEDDFGQKSVTPNDIGGGDIDYFNGVDVNRRVGSDRRLGEEGAADGVMISNAHGYDSIEFDVQFKNPNGQCTMSLMVRADGGLAWQDLVTNSAPQATLTTIGPIFANMTGQEQTPLHVYLGLLPVANTDGDNVAIPSTASANDTSTLRHGARMFLYLNLDNWSTSAISAEQSIYDLSATLKLAALAAPPPYDQVTIGGSGHYLHLTSTQKLRITTDPDTLTPILALYDAGVFVKEVAYAAVIYRVISDQAGNAINTVSREFLPLLMGSNLVTVTEPAIGTLTIDATWFEGYYG